MNWAGKSKEKSSQTRIRKSIKRGGGGEAFGELVVVGEAGSVVFVCVYVKKRFVGSEINVLFFLSVTFVSCEQW